jgi:hypothetical protein
MAWSRASRRKDFVEGQDLVRWAGRRPSHRGDPRRRTAASAAEGGVCEPIRIHPRALLGAPAAGDEAPPAGHPDPPTISLVPRRQAGAGLVRLALHVGIDGGNGLVEPDLADPPGACPSGMLSMLRNISSRPETPSHELPVASQGPPEGEVNLA